MRRTERGVLVAVDDKTCGPFDAIVPDRSGDSRPLEFIAPDVLRAAVVIDKQLVRLEVHIVHDGGNDEPGAPSPRATPVPHAASPATGPTSQSRPASPRIAVLGPARSTDGRLVLSADRRHGAFRQRVDNGWRVVHDGKPGKTYDWIGRDWPNATSLIRRSSPYGPPDPMAAALHTLTDSDGPGPESIELSPDGRHIRYIAWQDGRVRELHFSPDSRHFYLEALLSKKDNAWRAVLDGQQLDADEVVEIASNAAGAWAAHLRRDDRHTIRMGDGRLVDCGGVSEFDGINFVGLDAAGNVSAVVRLAGKYHLLRDARLGPAVDWINTAKRPLSPSGRMLYVAQQGRRMVAMLDGEELAAFDDLLDYSQWQHSQAGPVAVGIRDGQVVVVELPQAP